jgi:hypothetical protein
MATNNDNKNFIHRYVQAAGRAKMAAVTQVKMAKAQEARIRAELELWFDDLKQEGIDPRSQLGLMLTVERFSGGEPEPPQEEVW